MGTPQIISATPAVDVRNAWQRLALEPLRDPDDPRYVDVADARAANVAGRISNTLGLYGETEPP